MQTVTTSSISEAKAGCCQRVSTTMNRKRVEGRRDFMHVGQYQVAFDASGAFIGHQSTHARYRVQALTATNAVDFMKHHRQLIFAMMGNSSEDLEAYRAQPDTGGSTE
jgi:hypothetical protein